MAPRQAAPPGGYPQPGAPGAVPPLPAAAGWGTPPMPPGGVMPGGQAPPGKRRVGLMIGLIGGGVTAVLGVIVLLVVVVTQPDSHAVGTPSTAAGMNRDLSTERVINTDSLKRNLAEHAQGKVEKVVSAVYTGGSGMGPRPQVLFIGGEASSIDPASFVGAFVASAQNTQTVDPGTYDGDAACGELDGGTGTSAVSCVWADNDTFGQLLFLNNGQAVSELATLMHRMRPSLETTK